MNTGTAILPEAPEFTSGSHRKPLEIKQNKIDLSIKQMGATV
jgi:hypothetical protein